MSNEITVLMIEDNLGDARLINEMIKEVTGVNIKLEHAIRLASGLERIKKGGVDVVLLDLGLPDSNGLNSVTKIFEITNTLPIVVLTGYEDDITGLKAVQMGAQDYLIKLQIDSNLLVRCIRYAIQRKKMELTLHENDQIIKALSDFIIQINKEGTILKCKGKFEEHSEETCRSGENIFNVLPKNVSEKILDCIKDVFENGKMIVFDFESEKSQNYECRISIFDEGSIIILIKKLTGINIINEI